MLLERSLLTWQTVITGLGLLLWVVSISTCYWLVGIPRNYGNETLPASGSDVWSFSGLWEVCRVVWYPGLVIVTCRNQLVGHTTPHNIVDRVNTELIVSGVAILLMVLAMGFSGYSLKHPKYVYKRLAACLHLMTAGEI